MITCNVTVPMNLVSALIDGYGGPSVQTEEDIIVAALAFAYDNREFWCPVTLTTPAAPTVRSSPSS